MVNLFNFPFPDSSSTHYLHDYSLTTVTQRELLGSHMFYNQMLKVINQTVPVSVRATSFNSIKTRVRAQICSVGVF